MKDEKPLTTKWTFVEPTMAKEWLAKNIQNNRRISMARVEQYARDIKNGLWAANGEAIKFSDADELIDGQHRLLACVEANLGFWTNVVRGLPQDSFMTLDRHQSRSIGQVIFLETGIGEANNTASALRWLSCFENGIMRSKQQAKLTANETLDLLSKHPKLPEFIRKAVTLQRHFKLSAVALTATMMYLFHKQDAEKAEKFFEDLESGVGLRSVDPAFRLRQIIIRRQSTRHKLSQYEVAAFAFKAWQAEKEGRVFKDEMRWRVGDTFPSIGPVPGLKESPVGKANLPRRPEPGIRGGVVRLLSKKVSLDQKVSNQ